MEQRLDILVVSFRRGIMFTSACIIHIHIHVILHIIKNCPAQKKILMAKSTLL
jgi:hypothetical protein